MVSAYSSGSNKYLKCDIKTGLVFRIANQPMIYIFVDLISTLENYLLHSMNTKCSVKKKQDIVLFLKKNCFFYLGLLRIPVPVNHFITLANLHWILRIFSSLCKDSFFILS